MKIKMLRSSLEAIGAAKLVAYGFEDRHWIKTTTTDLEAMPLPKIKALLKLLIEHKHVKGIAIAIKDIESWLIVIERGGTAKSRSVEQFSALLKETVAKSPGQRLFYKDDDADLWFCYYMGEIEYTPTKTERGGGTTPAHVRMTLHYEERGGVHSTTHTFWPENCLGWTPEEALARANYWLETPDLRAWYQSEVDAFMAVFDKIGKQFLAVGVADTSGLGNAVKRRDNDEWWWDRNSSVQLDKDGEPARVVIDVYSESEKPEKRRAKVDSLFWRRRQKMKKRGGDIEADLDEDDVVAERDKDGELKTVDVEIPLHPYLVCFDMKRHLRLKTHISQLTEYQYDRKLGEKLVLPSDVSSLVSMLLAHKGGFQDIIAGKGGGATILCAGPPGTGKTLTAEVYSEVIGRPLYSVQASQLGTSPDELEAELLKVFARAARWSAILMLDEADVYIASRGSDLEQNAIVGVFLRVLEYYKGVLFMTTNRSDLVDDAIASRCIARIDYERPPVTDQKRIWTILAQTAGIPLAAAEIDAIVRDHSDLSGRDIKNLLKLASLVASATDKPVDAKAISFVRRFKPTADESTRKRLEAKEAQERASSILIEPAKVAPRRA